MPVANKPVGDSVVDGSNGGIPRIIQRAVWHSCSPQECPHITVAPVQDGVDTHEGWPVCTAGAEHFLTICVWVTSADSKQAMRQAQAQAVCLA